MTFLLTLPVLRKFRTNFSNDGTCLVAVTSRRDSFNALHCVGRTLPLRVTVSVPEVETG